MKKILLGFILITSHLFSQELNLLQSYEGALGFESKLQSFTYQTLAKKEEINQAKAALYPQIDLQMSATDRHYRLNYSKEKRDEQYYTATLSGRLALYKPENYNNIEQSKIKYKFSSLYLEQLRQELALNVTDAYVSILRAQNALVVAKSYKEANEIRYNQIKKMYEKRLANKMDLLESQVTYDSSKVKVSSEMHNLYLAKMKFRNLTGFETFEFPTIDFENLKINQLFHDFPKEQLDSLNFEIQKSKLSVNLVGKQIEQFSYGHHPKVDLSASFSKYDTNSLYTDYETESRLMINFKLPIYQGGYVESKIAQSRYLLSAANADLNNIQKETITAFEEQNIQLSNAKENILLYKEAINSSKLYLHAVEQGYERGLKNLIDLEDAKTKLFENKFKLIDASYNYIKSYVSILALYGKLDKNKLESLDAVLLLSK